MALNAYLTLTADTQGEIRGSVTQAGREDSILVIGFSHAVKSPREAASGLATGKRQHAPVVITKDIDPASPLLYNVLVNNESISEWRLDFWQPSRSGREFQFYTVQLHNASIAGIETEMLNNRYPDNVAHPPREHVSFAYQKITWTWQDGGITAESDWETPIV